MCLTGDYAAATSYEGSSPDTFGYRDPQKAHGIAAVLGFYSFPLP